MRGLRLIRSHTPGDANALTWSAQTALRLTGVPHPKHHARPKCLNVRHFDSGSVNAAASSCMMSSLYLSASTIHVTQRDHRKLQGLMSGSAGCSVRSCMVPGLCRSCSVCRRTQCPLCKKPYLMQAVDDPKRKHDNTNPKWAVPLEFIEWQPSYTQQVQKTTSPHSCSA